MPPIFRSRLVDAKGDLLVGARDNQLEKLGVGTNGKVLTAKSSSPQGVSWETPSGGGGGTLLPADFGTPVDNVEYWGTSGWVQDPADETNNPPISSWLSQSLAATQAWLTLGLTDQVEAGLQITTGSGGRLLLQQYATGFESTVQLDADTNGAFASLKMSPAQAAAPFVIKDSTNAVVFSVGVDGTITPTPGGSPIRTITASEWALSTDGTILADATAAAIEINLPSAAGVDGLRLIIKKIDATTNTVTVFPNGSELVDGASSVVVTASVVVQCDGIGWWQIGGPALPASFGKPVNDIAYWGEAGYVADPSDETNSNAVGAWLAQNVTPGNSAELTLGYADLGTATLMVGNSGNAQIVLENTDPGGGSSINFQAASAFATMVLKAAPAQTAEVITVQDSTTSARFGVNPDGSVYLTGLTTGIRTITADDTAVASDSTILVDATAGAVTVSLPPAASAGKRFTVKKIDASANTVTVDPDGAETIDGASTFVITAQYDAPTVQSDGTNWWII